MLVMASKRAHSDDSKLLKETTNVVLSRSSAGNVERKPGPSSKPNSLPDGSMEAEPVSAGKRQLMIAEAAYYISQHRGFGAGCEMDDWLLAEKQIDTALSGEAAAAQAG
jgi:hypothetical protein